jgi:hypothetical protein
MNPHKYFASAELISNPLCGIDTYKDILNLATGQITRNIYKLVLTGEETIVMQLTGLFYVIINTSVDLSNGGCICTHYINKQVVNTQLNNGEIKQDVSNTYGGVLVIKDTSYSTVNSFKSYLTQQYTNGTPVTVWYVLATSETEQITVPSGLSGTVEGYLIQDGTPTPEAPIYPTANTAKGWYNINAYKRSVLVWNTDTAYERSDGSWT